MLPKRRKPARAGIRESPQIRSPGHMQWVRTRFECAVAGSGGCGGAMHAHHVKTRGAGGGDEQVVPLCAIHHDEVHKGRLTFEARHKVNLDQMAAALWREDQYHRLKWERDCDGRS